MFPLERLNKWDVDEIIFLDISAFKEKRKFDPKILEVLSKSCFVPLTVGGGITNVDDVRKLIIKESKLRNIINKQGITEKKVNFKIGGFERKKIVYVIEK